MIFRQSFDPGSATLTYLLADESSRLALLIDPVREQVERDMALLDSLDLRLAYTLETHIHADHISGASALRQRTGCQVTVPAPAKLPCADRWLREGEPLLLGNVRIDPVATPGHTLTDYCYVVGDRVFTGDTLFIDGCGRTDFQQGNAGLLYDMVMEKLFSLPGETLIYPGHDYNQRRVSTIEQERLRNPRLGAGRTREDFVALMAALHLPHPQQMGIALPANLACGKTAGEEA